MLELDELDEFLLTRALEHDSPILLFRLACEHLVSARVIRPGVIKVIERVATAREAGRSPRAGYQDRLVEQLDHLVQDIGCRLAQQRQQDRVAPLRFTSRQCLRGQPTTAAGTAEKAGLGSS